jgi:hypothetical protein
MEGNSEFGEGLSVERRSGCFSEGVYLVWGEAQGQKMAKGMTI